ncbi:hypothetical protein E4U45_007085 [Claviceps purpurea]|nr:hypothetical protein E4U45_007085 [Claviceps purpurea]
MNARAAIRDATLVSARVFKALAEGAHRREETIQLFLVHCGYQQDSGRVPESKQPKTLTEIRTKFTPTTPLRFSRNDHYRNGNLMLSRMQMLTG